jgi:hypothetical protein
MPGILEQKQFASFTNSLNNNLIAWYGLDEGSGNRLNLLNNSQYILVPTGTPASVAGAKNNACQFSRSPISKLSAFGVPNFNSGDWSFTFWFNLSPPITVCLVVWQLGIMLTHLLP